MTSKNGSIVTAVVIIIIGVICIGFTAYSQYRANHGGPEPVAGNAAIMGFGCLATLAGVGALGLMAWIG